MSTQRNPHSKIPHQCRQCGNIIRDEEDYCEHCWADIEYEEYREDSDNENRPDGQFENRVVVLRFRPAVEAS